MYEIGILRALGCKNQTVALMFMLNMGIVALIIAFISIAGVRILDPMLNSMLIDNLENMLNTALIKNLKILRFNFLSAVVDMLTVILLSFLSSARVFLACRKVKPINIIRSKE